MEAMVGRSKLQAACNRRGDTIKEGRGRPGMRPTHKMYLSKFKIIINKQKFNTHKTKEIAEGPVVTGREGGALRWSMAF